MSGQCTILSGGARLCHYSQSEGDSGIYETLQLMRRLALRDARDERIISAARKAAGRARTPVAIAHNIFLWVAENYPYSSDPKDREFVMAPIHTLSKQFYRRYPYRDCDDLSALYASLLQSVGIPSYLQAIAWRRYEFTHVYNIVEIAPHQYIPADLVMGAKGFGRERPRIIRHIGIAI